MEIPSVHPPDIAVFSRPPVSAQIPIRPVASSGSANLDTMAGEQRQSSPERPRRADNGGGTQDQGPTLEEASIRALADLRRARQMAEIVPLPMPVADLARKHLLASVAEIRHAIVPPSLTHLNRRG